MTERTSASVAFRPCGAMAQDPPLSPWYGHFLRAQAPGLIPAGQVKDRLGTPPDLRIAAEIACSDGDLDTARDDIARAIDGFRASGDTWGLADALAVRAAIARAAGEVQAAASTYRESLSAFIILGDMPSVRRVYLALADALFADGSYDAAADVLLEALDMLPGEPVILTGLGYSLWYSGHPADALAYLGQALSAGIGNRAALSALGQIQIGLGRTATAVSNLDLALTVSAESSDDDDADLRSARALALARLGRRTEAETELRNAMQLAPERPRSLWRAAEVHLLCGDTEAAKSALRSAQAGDTPLPAADATEVKRLLAELSALPL